MERYQNGKIYKMVCNKTGLVYIGSTTEKYLSNRLKGHRKDYRYFLNGKNDFITSFKILENDDCYIELVELFPCNSKDELLARERYYFDTIKCVNKLRPKVTEEERITKDREYDKKYRETNKEKKQQYDQEYHTKNKEKIQEKNRERYETNKEKRQEQNREWFENNKKKKQQYDQEYRAKNKEKISELKKVIFTCICGSECRIADKARHEKTQKHLNFVKN
jgi:hypothetical protein